MQWTKETPNRSGYYWRRGGRYDVGPHVVEIVVDAPAVSVYSLGSEDVDDAHEIGGEWWGPIAPPDYDAPNVAAGSPMPPTLEDMARKLGTTKAGVLDRALMILQEQLKKDRSE